MDGFYKHSFRIIGTSPQDIPMGRLAAYMSELASLIGNEDKLRFDQLTSGSACINFYSPEEYKIEAVSRIIEARSGQPNAAAAGPWRKVNRLLEKDGWLGEMPLLNGDKIIFPGKISSFHAPLRSIVQKTSIQGRLVRIEGVGDIVKVGIEIDGNLNTGQIALNSALGAQLAVFFHRIVRLDGDGKWGRDGDGKWSLESLNVTSFEDLQDFSLKETLKKLRSIIPQEGGRFLVNSIDEMRRV